MIDAVHQQLGSVLTRWTTGGAAMPVAPEAWRDAIADGGSEPELALLALAGQLVGAMTVAAAPAELVVLPDLPRLALPTLPEHARPLFRRILAAARDGGQRHQLLAFLAARGWAAHPGDWMPGASEEELPDVYAAWRDWAALAGGGDAGAASADALSDETWDDFGPAARAAAFSRLRRMDPAAARDLLAARIAGESADSRLRLAAVLALGLSPDDRALLASLQSDRAPKVKALAASLLARLGDGGGTGEEAAELAGYFSIQTKGLLRRTRVVAANALKTAAQRNRRQELLACVDFPSFATALEIGVEELVGSWNWGSDRQADGGFAAMIAGSAPDAVVASAIDLVAEDGTEAAIPLFNLLPRLSAEQRAGAAEALLRARGADLLLAAAIGGGECRLADPLRTTAGSALLGRLAGDDSGRNVAFAAELHALGLLASQEGAARTIETLGKAGLLAADPRLDMLRLNAAIEDRGVTG